MPRGLSRVARWMAPVLVGGADAHANELEGHMAITVAGLKRAAERS